MGCIKIPRIDANVVWRRSDRNFGARTSKIKRERTIVCISKDSVATEEMVELQREISHLPDKRVNERTPPKGTRSREK